MWRIIDGLLYDTEKSELIYTDVLKGRKYYRTKGGRFFCAHKNGDVYTKTEKQIQDLLGTFDYDKYVEIFDVPKEA